MLIPVVLMQATLPFAADATLEARLQTRFEACVTRIEAAPEAAYEAAMAWSNEAFHPFAVRCAAMALIEMGRVEEGAERLASLAATSSSGPPEQRVAVLVQAANAYLLARLPEKAKTALDRALSLTAPDDPNRYELLLDRATAFALTGDFRRTEEDLNDVLAARPGDALALRLRADARMRQGAFDLAVKDAEDAVAADPKNIDALLVRGQTIEARRTGQAPQ
jgi:tetratricopeptide (TPR) repeat protein